jgi:hypothetical protein
MASRKGRGKEEGKEGGRERERENKYAYTIKLFLSVFYPM